MKYKTAELTGSLLDAAVRIAVGEDAMPWVEDPSATIGHWQPSTSWAHGGPLIERERITLRADFSTERPGEWAAMGNGLYAEGPTPLIAAMRAFVAAEVGPEVELPDPA